jgi:protein TonB
VTEESVSEEAARLQTEALLERQQKMEAAALERQQLREASESLSLSFATDLADKADSEIDEQERAARKKWIMIIAVAAASILLVVFRLLHAGAVPGLKHIAAAQPTSSATDSNTVPDTSTPDAAATKLPATAKPTAATPAAQTTEAPQDADQKQSAPAEAQSKMMHDQLLAPTRIPQEARNVPNSEAPPAGGLGGAGMEALNGSGAPAAVFNGSGQSKVNVVPRVVTVSAGVAVGMLTHKTQPVYPPIAKSARVQGTIVLQATISKSGNVDNIRVVSGPVMLRQAALDAVKTWHYRPYMLNNSPTEVETTINVIFALGG